VRRICIAIGSLYLAFYGAAVAAGDSDAVGGGDAPRSLLRLEPETVSGEPFSVPLLIWLLGLAMLVVAGVVRRKNRR
jgi:MYXO-CTERM domain-containing protein